MEWCSLTRQIKRRIHHPYHRFRYENLLDERFLYHGLRLFPCMDVQERQRLLLKTLQRIHKSRFVVRQGVYHLLLQVEL